MTATHTAAQLRKPVLAAKSQYPELPASESRLFWLAAYLRDQAELLELNKLVTEMHRRNRSSVLLHALYAAQRHQEDDIKLTLGYVMQDGLLPLAWHGTTVFAKPEVLQ